MEKHRCKICYRRFSNGRAMGGHMRSHLAKLPIPPKTQHQNSELRNSAESNPIFPSSSSSSRQGGRVAVRSLNHDDQVLIENPMIKYSSFRSTDSDCTENHDRESDTESPKNPTRKRSKRSTRKVITAVAESPPAEPEPTSSVSDTICEEDLAFCLMMLSRDQWTKEKVIAKKEVEADKYMEDDDEEEEEDEDEEEDSFYRARVRARAVYKCETCKKVFKSYQALGGHRASHKKIKSTRDDEGTETSLGGDNVDVGGRIFECPFCFKVFGSGQALGGHKKVHLSNAATKVHLSNAATTSSITAASSAKFRHKKLIDLNLPAPEEDDDSTVSNAEIFHQFKRIESMAKLDQIF